MNRFFIGPLTPAQQKRRRKARAKWQRISELMYTWNIRFAEAMKIHSSSESYLVRFRHHYYD